MNRFRTKRHGMAGGGLLCLALAAVLAAQQNPPIMYLPPSPPVQGPPAAQPAPQPQQPQQRPATSPASQIATTDVGGFVVQNASLVQMVDMIARRLKINYIIDPRVKGSVNINTYGEVKPTELMNLMQTILRINSCTIVKVGDLYRIVPADAVSQLPMTPIVNGKGIPGDETMVLNLVFLKYATVDEMAKLLQPFLGEGARASTYPAANLLLVLDNARNMKRTMDLIAMFDSDSFAGQRVRSYETSHSRPSDLAKEMESVFKAYALSEKNAAVRFLPVDRINTLIAVAPNPGIFEEVDKWLKKLDVQPKAAAGAVDNYVYRLKYGRAETLAMAVMALYGGFPMSAMLGMGGMGMGGMGMGGMGMGGYGMGGYGMGGMGMGGYGTGGYGTGGYGMGGYGGGMGMGGYGMGGYGGGSSIAYGQYNSQPMASSPASLAANAAAAMGGNPSGTDLTGQYLGAGTGKETARIPRVIPNPFDNTLLIQANPQEWESISKLLEQLDVPPRQVLIEAKIYEVDLKGAFSAGVSAYLQAKGASDAKDSPTAGLSRTLLGSATSSGLSMTSGLLVGRSRELLGVLTANENASYSKVISEPSVIATDSVPAFITVGQEVPTLASQALASGAQQNGSSLFTNTISNRNTGITLSVTARVNSSGIVTLYMQQEISDPIAPSTTSAIQSPSFSKRSISTQLTVQDGDTVAIGGSIQESDGNSSSGVPFLHRLPVLGAAFGAKSTTRARTEVIVFFTPHVIYDTNQLIDASEELMSKLKRIRKIVKE